VENLPSWTPFVFAAVFGGLFAIDLVVHSKGHRESRKKALMWTLIWVAAGLSFWIFIWAVSGADPAHEYFAVYILEKSLSLDNLFVFLIIFKSMGIPTRHQRTGLSWGILGALIFRAVLVMAGVSAVERWSWLEYVFAAFLFYAAWQAFREDPSEKKKSRSVEWLARRLPVSKSTDTSKFIVGKKGARQATPLLIAVIAIEVSDFIFAVDSITVALSITRNEFLIYTANAFAILGLRALYILLEHTIARLRYLHYGLAAILAFAGLKMVAGHYLEIPPLVSVAIIVACMAAAAWFSVRDGGGTKRRRAA
jgi:tellurite resistance protein TerC